jgi:hypothetical protein
MPSVSRANYFAFTFEPGAHICISVSEWKIGANHALNERRRIMKKVSLLAIAFATVLAGWTHATPINVVVDLGSPRLIPNEFDGNTFGDLNGIALNGQVLSFNVVFASQAWVATYSDLFHIGLTMNTDAGALPGFVMGSGYALDSTGNPVGLPGLFGSASSSSGDMNVGVFPGNAGGNLFIFSGVHFDLTLPVDPSVVITGADLNLYEDTYLRPFGVDTIPNNNIPDNASTLFLIGLALAGIAVLKRTLRSRPERTPADAPN